MYDFFDVLSLPHRARLEDGELHAAYAKKSREAHPDHGGAEDLAALVNAAYEALRVPEKRLKHLLEVVAPESARAWRTLPLDEVMMDLFSRLGRTLDAATKFLEKKGRAKSSLARALLANEEMMHREQLEEIGTSLAGHINILNEALPTVDVALETPDEAAWQRLATLQARFAYLAKWQTQVREHLLRLM